MKVKETAPAYLKQRQAFTYQDYLDMPDDVKRYQVIDGDLIMTPAPTTAHQFVSGNLAMELRQYVKKNNLGFVLCAPTDVVLDDTNVFQPDILFISNERKSIIKHENIQGAPDLIIEILSPATGYYDLV